QNVGRRSVSCKAICRTAQADPTLSPLGSLPDGGLSLLQQGGELRLDISTQKTGADRRQMRPIHIYKLAGRGNNRAILRVAITLEGVDDAHAGDGVYG